MPFAFIGPLLGWIAAGVGTLGASAAVLWQTSTLSRARRRAVRALRPLRKEARRVRRALARWKRALVPEARAFAKAQVKERFRTLPIDALKEAGATGVRWSALRQAGYRTLGDLEGRRAVDLAAVPGVGETTARRVVVAARQLSGRIRREPTALPAADLEAPVSTPLASRTLDWLEAQEAGGDEPRRVVETARELGARLEEVRGETSFGAWLTQPWRRERTQRTLEKAARVAAQAAAAAPLLERSRDGRRRMGKWKRPRRSAEQLKPTFKDRYAECCTLLEDLFSELGLRRRRVASGQGGLSDEVARRVEAFPLRTAGMRVTLRRYQEFGAKYVLAQERTILGDEMGLGKTMQALSAMAHLSEGSERTYFFVVAPAGLLINWSREIERFTPLEAYLLHGDDLEGNLEAWASTGGVAVTSYSTLRQLDLGRTLEEVPGAIDLCVVDEAHFVKNPEAGRTQAVRKLLAASARACLMSGTPMENHPAEFLNLIEAVRPQEAEELRRRDLHLDAAAGSVRAFHRAVAKVYLRRNQEDVLTELPAKIELEEWVELSAAERRNYNEKVRARNFMGMRQAATLGAESSVSAKLDALDVLLEDHRMSGRKVLVFSFFLAPLEAVKRRCEVVGTIRGGVSPQEKQALCDAFQEKEGHAVLLLQIQAGGQGLNLQKASVVVLLEPQTKPSLEDQAIARAHRMGQTNRVLVHRLLARDTCDQSLLALVAEKEELFDAYARKSLVKEASGQATEATLSRAVIEAEEERLMGEEP